VSLREWLAQKEPDPAPEEKPGVKDAPAWTAEHLQPRDRPRPPPLPPPAAAPEAPAAPTSTAAPAWTAEEVVDVPRGRRLIEEQFPELAPARLQELGVGWDNTAYVVNETYVFRFPRREVAVALLETEARALPAIASRLPLAVPVPIFAGVPSAAFRWPFSGYRFLAGRTACRARLDDQQRLALAEPLGRFLAALHALPVAEMVALGVGGDSIGRLDLATRVPRALEVLDRLPEPSLGVPAQTVRELVQAAASLRVSPARVPAHGDLYVRHLLVDEQGALCGVIDWGDLHIGNPAVDLSVAHGFLPPAARPAFLRAYGRRVPAPTWWLARFRAVFSALMILDYGRQTGDADLEREGRRSLSNAVGG
jgi:aminoglycoside phosphotransferase (APT) family kinase protein